MSVTVEAAATLARFGPEGFGVVPLLETEHVRVLLAAFEPGQEIPLHAPEVDLVVTVVQGAGELYAGGRVRQLRAGDVAVVPAGEPRGLRARSTRLLVVNTVTPPPGKADHARLDAGAAWPDGHEDEP
jgi:quercetin dioxygenase-like cupin family protein